MTPDYPGLKAEIAKPAYQGQSDDAIVATLNAPGAAVLRPGSYLTEAGILRVLGPTTGDAALSALETASAGSSLLTRAVRILRDIAGGGLDFGLPETQGMLDSLQAQGVLVGAVVATLKEHGSSPGPSIAQTLGFPGVTVNDLVSARDNY